MSKNNNYFIGVNLFLKHLFIVHIDLTDQDKNIFKEQLNLKLPNDIIDIDYIVLSE